MSNKTYPIPDNVQSMSLSGNSKPLNDPPRAHFGQEADILGSRTGNCGDPDCIDTQSRINEEYTPPRIETGHESGHDDKPKHIKAPELYAKMDQMEAAKITRAEALQISRNTLLRAERERLEVAGIPRYMHDFDGGYKPAPSTQNGRAMDSQIGGNHYAKLPIQPGEYAMANNLNYWQGNVIKYVTRYRDKGGKQDLEKAIDCLRKLIEAEYG